MKILIIMGGFFPGKKFGGPPVSVDNFCSLMVGHADCYLLTLNHDLGESEVYPMIEEEWNDRGNVKVKYLSDKDYHYATFFKIASILKPDIIYLQGLFQQCILPCLKIAKKLKIKVVLAPRGELCVGAFKKRYKKIPYIWFLRKMRLLDNLIFQSTSDEETEGIRKYLGIKTETIYYLPNIPSIPQNLPQRAFKNVGDARFVFISRILWKKNLLSALYYFKEVKGNVVFDIYGPQEDGQYWNDCKKAINELPTNIKVEYKGVLTHDVIHKTFSRYDAFLFPTLSENYGHVIAEALVSGCIPIISDQTPWSDMNEAGAGWAIPLDNEVGFVRAIQEVINMNNDSIKVKRKNISNYLKAKLRIEELKKSYLEVFQETKPQRV